MTFQEPNSPTILATIFDIATLSETFEDADEPPSPQAVASSFYLVAQTVIEHPNISFPYGSATIDGEGGVRVEWEVNDRHLRLLVDKDPSVSIIVYYEHPDYHGISPITSTSDLSSWFVWLTGEPPRPR